MRSSRSGTRKGSTDILVMCIAQFNPLTDGLSLLIYSHSALPRVMEFAMPMVAKGKVNYVCHAVDKTILTSIYVNNKCYLYFIIRLQQLGRENNKILRYMLR